jgi:hypothetical protein
MSAKRPRYIPSATSIVTGEAIVFEMEGREHADRLRQIFRGGVTATVKSISKLAPSPLLYFDACR